MTYEPWLTYFRENPSRQQKFDDALDWSRKTPLTPVQARLIARSLQRFELGEGGNGERLLAKAAQAGDPVYTAALKLFVVEEQKHSALFLKALQYLSAAPLASHWSDRAFVLLRRSLGLRMELMLFLVAESVALEYFRALRDGAPDPLIQLLGARVYSDEIEHIRFQIHRLAGGYAGTPAGVRRLIHAGWWFLALGAALVLAWDHRGALRVCGVPPRRFLPAALHAFAAASSAVMSPVQNSGPSAGAYTDPDIPRAGPAADTRA